MSRFLKIRDFFKKSVLRNTAEFSVSDTGDPLILTCLCKVGHFFPILARGLFPNLLEKALMLSYLVKLGLYFGMTLYLHPFFVYASRESSATKAFVA